jgi:hypothetical protein
VTTFAGLTSVTSTSFVGDLTGNASTATSATTATNATNTAITDNTTSVATWYPTVVSTTTGNLPQTTSSTKLSFVPSTGTLTATAIDNTPIGGTTPAAGTFTTLTATGQTSLGGAAGSETVRVTTGANTGKYTGLSSDVASNTQLIGGVGGTGFVVFSSATNSIRLRTNGAAGNDQMQVAHTASAVNYVQVTGAATGQPTTVSSQGSDASIGMLLRVKGSPTGPGFRVENNNGANICFAVTTSGANVANYMRVDPAAAGSAAGLSSQGTDADIDLTLTPKGAGAVKTTKNAYVGSSLYIAP